MTAPALPLRLRAWREYRSLTQQELADRAGVARRTIVDAEAGKRTPRPATLRRLAAALGVEGWELHNRPREEHETIVQFLGAVDRLGDVLNTIGIAVAGGRDFAHVYRAFLDRHGGEYEGDDGHGVWTTLGDSVLVNLFAFWQELGTILVEEADESTKQQMQFALDHWVPELERAGVMITGRDRVARSPN